MTDSTPHLAPNSWNLPTQRAPAHVKIRVASTLEMMRFSGNVVDTYIDAMGKTVLGFLQSINTSDDFDFIDGGEDGDIAK
jgi:hypothetical protein